jgi:inosose dehydratase
LASTPDEVIVRTIVLPSDTMKRRESLALLGAAGTFAALAGRLDAAGSDTPHIATNTYPWGTFRERDGNAFPLHSDQLLAAIASCGIHGYEPIINSPAEFRGLGGRLKRHGLEMRSLYVNSTLHDRDMADESIATVLAIAEAARPLGTRIVVTNPSPLEWGGTSDKTDAQLRTQAVAIDSLGASLRKLGLQLAYHNHDAELRQGGREFHHMLTATDPENVKFCLDAHWVFRGCGNSELAVFDALSHYHQRIVELHLRQSTSGIWQEAFTPAGDIDYCKLIAFLTERDIKPHLVLEQAIEGKSPGTMSAVEAHKKSAGNLRETV